MQSTTYWMLLVSCGSPNTTATKLIANSDWILYGKKERQADKTGLFRYDVQHIGKDGVMISGPEHAETHFRCKASISTS